MLPSLEMDFQLLMTTKYIMLMIVCIFPRMLKTFWERGWNFLKQFANMKYCTYQIGPTTIFPRPFIIAHKSSPHFLFLQDLANKEDVGFKSKLVNQSWEQSSNDFHYWYFISMKSNTYEITAGVIYNFIHCADSVLYIQHVEMFQEVLSE